MDILTPQQSALDDSSQYSIDNLESNDLLRSIFQQYDKSNNGYIGLEDFLTITKENWPVNNLDEQKLQSLVGFVDPHKTRRVNYNQFINGIRYMTSDEVTNAEQKSSKPKTNPFLMTTSDDTADRNSNGSSNETFNEYDAYTDTERTSSNTNTSNKNNTESSLIEFEDLFNTSNPFVETNSHANNRSNSPEQYIEDFGLLEANGGVHRSDSYNQTTSTIKSNILKKRASGLFYNNNLMNSNESNSSNSNGFMTTSMNSNNEQIIEELEHKIRELENHIDQLKADRVDDEDKFNRLQNENYKLNQKIQELDDMHQDYEKNFRHTIELERNRSNEHLNRLNSNFNEEKENLMSQIHKCENDLSYYKDEVTKYVRQVNELNKQVDEKSTNEYQLEEKLTNLKLDYQRVLKERDLYKDDNEISKSKYNIRIDALTKELNDIRQQSQQQNLKKRGQAVNNDEINASLNRAKDLETELNQTKFDYKQAQAQIQDLNAQLLRQSLDTGKLLLTATQVPSLAAEMEVMSKDELMDKLKYEQVLGKRYKEYIERLLASIMEKNPDILEVRQVPQQQQQQQSSNKAKITTNGSVQFSKY